MSTPFSHQEPMIRKWGISPPAPPPQTPRWAAQFRRATHAARPAGGASAWLSLPSVVVGWTGGDERPSALASSTVESGASGSRAERGQSRARHRRRTVDRLGSRDPDSSELITVAFPPIRFERAEADSPRTTRSRRRQAANRAAIASSVGVSACMFIRGFCVTFGFLATIHLHGINDSLCSFQREGDNDTNG